MKTKKGCQLLDVFGSGMQVVSRLQTLTSSSWQILHFSLHVILIYWIIGEKHNNLKKVLLGYDSHKEHGLETAT